MKQEARMCTRSLILACILFACASPGWSSKVELDQAAAEARGLHSQIRDLQQEIVDLRDACADESVLASRYHQLERLQLRFNATRAERGSLDQGGDDCATAYNIGELPFCDSGTTVGYTNRFNPEPHCGASNAPDVVYSFTPETTVAADISLCGSSFNTLIHVWRDCPSTGLAVLWCCNDDSPECAPQSCCSGVTFFAGDTYYIIVDGSGVDSGNYILTIELATLPPSCAASPNCSGCVSCPPGATIEAEDCPGSYPDPNGGCYSWPVGFNNISCGETWCAKLENSTSFVDHDAYYINLFERDSLRFCIFAEFDFDVKFYHYIPGG